MDDLKRLMEDQRIFNRQIFKRNGAPPEAVLERLRHLSLGMIEESIEFLRTFEWKPHRKKVGSLSNLAHSHEELIDMFKFWLSLADLTDFPLDRLEELYHAKSRVVRYRYQTEWMSSIDRPCVVVDIDNVLADYIRGFYNWAQTRVPVGLTADETAVLRVRLKAAADDGRWLDAAAVGMEPAKWQSIKHEFRSTGGKLLIPVFPDARGFLEWCRLRGWLILLITSRPIDQYPNIFTETITWLTEANLPFDRLWWADRKAERLDMGGVPLSQVKFAVDDDLNYVNQFANRQVRTYWLTRSVLRMQSHSHIFSVRSLTDVQNHFDAGDPPPWK